MFFQTLDSKQECYKIFCNGELVDDYNLDGLTHSWSPISYLANEDIQYAKIWCKGQSLSEVCPEHLLSRWQDANSQALVYLKTFKNAKVDLNEVCFYDLVPEKFLINFYDIKNQITQHVFQQYKKPKNYDFMKDLCFFLEDIKNNPLKLDLKNVNFSDPKVRQSISRVKNSNNKIVYNPWRTVTGRLTTEKDSFPILTLNKELRGVIKPKNDLLVELDYNAAEVRVLLALLGQQQPKEDIHVWISKNIFNDKYDRETTKKKVFAWLYNPNAKNKKLNEFLNRDKIYEKYFHNNCVLTPYGRKIPVDREKALNYLIQSTSSDMLLTSAMKINKIIKHKQSSVSFCIHDSLVLDVAAEDKNLLQTIQQAFSNTAFGIIKSNVSIGKDFGDMRKIL